MWFGTRAFMQEILDPQANPEYGVVGWEQATQFIRGGLGVVRSVDSHREYSLSWGLVSRADAQRITDYADGVYGTGLIYFVDPVSADRNVLPKSWATPSIAGYDGVPLAGDDRPVLSANTDFSQGYPAELATYSLGGSASLRSLFIPIPPGHTGWFGVHGDVSADGYVKVTPFEGSTPGTVIHPTVLSTSSITRVNTSVAGASVTGMEISLDNPTADPFTLAGMIAQVLPDGATPETGGFISGQGHAGCQFIGRPSVTPYAVAAGLDLVGLTARLGEVG